MLTFNGTVRQRLNSDWDFWGRHQPSSFGDQFFSTKMFGIQIVRHFCLTDMQEWKVNLFCPWHAFEPPTFKNLFCCFLLLKKHVKFLVLLSKEFGGWVHFWWWSSDAGLKFANWNLLHGIWNFRVQPKIDVWQLHLFCAGYIICKEDQLQDFRIQDFLVKYVKIHFAPIMCNSALLV